MAFHAFSHAAAKALLLLGENTKPAARKAYQTMAEALDKPEGNKTARNWSVYSRVMSELWRNGWVAAGARAPGRAVHAATTAVSLDDSDYYTHWLLAYAYKIRSRSAGQYKSSWKQDMESALRHYEKALALLNKEKPQNAVVAGERNAVSIERAETFVYLSEPDRALREMERIIRDPNRAKPDAWQDWAYAFALHQAGRSYEAAEICERLLAEKDANNDIRLLLAACQARCHMALDGRQTIREFHKRRSARSLSAEDAEPTWTVALEIERGAFPPDMPGGGEKYWTESMVRAQLDESADTKISIPTTSFLPSDDVILGAPRGDGATAAPGAAVQAPKPAGKAAPRKKAPAKKKVVKKKAPAKKAAKKKAAKKTAKRKVAKKAAKKRPARSKAPARKAARRKAGRKAAAKRRAPKRKAAPRRRR